MANTFVSTGATTYLNERFTIKTKSDHYRENYLHQQQSIKITAINHEQKIHDENNGQTCTTHQAIDKIRGGSVFAGWNPLGYGITALGLSFLEFDGSLDSDVGRFLATFKSGRKRQSQLKQQWLEILRVSKKAQSLRIYRKMDELLQFCVSAGFLY